MKVRLGKRQNLMPEYIAKSVSDIDFDYLKKQGILVALIDLDGTVVKRADHNVSTQISTTLKKQPLDIFIATNRPKSRDLKDLKEKLSAKGVVHPKGMLGKPFKSYFKNALEITGFKPNQIIMIGDRYIQDIIGANRAGLHTLVVSKLDEPTNQFDKFISSAERRYTARLTTKYKDIKSIS